MDLSWSWKASEVPTASEVELGGLVGATQPQLSSKTWYFRWSLSIRSNAGRNTHFTASHAALAQRLRMMTTPWVWEEGELERRLVESQTEESPLPGQGHSLRVRRSMFLDFMISKAARS